MHKKTITGSRLFVLDTNVLMHDPAALFRFREHDIFIPMVVLEELDAAKKGISEVARNVRQVSRFLDDLVSDNQNYSIKEGLPLQQFSMAKECNSTGRLHFQTQITADILPSSLPGNTPDNQIIGIALALKKSHSDISVTLVSKDINLRVKASILELHSEDYYNDQVLDDVDLLFTGQTALPQNFWESHGKDIKSWQEHEQSWYEITGPLSKHWYPNQFLHLEANKNHSEFNARVSTVKDNGANITSIIDYSSKDHAVWSIMARNLEQNYALNLLMDPNIDFVTLLGIAGTGKTLLTLAAGLAQTLDQNLYQEILMTRATVPVGEDIGFLPGTEEEKMAPWMGALMDNLEVLTMSNHEDNWSKAVTNDLVQHRIKIRSLNFMRGRTFLNRFIIIDEAQNLTSKQMKTLITRAGPGTKVVCLGNVAQIDTPYLTETTSGLTYAVDRFQYWEHSGHVTLMRGERSRLADFASSAL